MFKRLGVAGWGLIALIAAIGYLVISKGQDAGYGVVLKDLGIGFIALIVFTLFYTFVVKDK